MLLNLTLAKLLFEADIWKLRVLLVSLVDVVTDAIGEGTIVGKASEERRWGIGNPLSQSPGALVNIVTMNRIRRKKAMAKNRPSTPSMAMERYHTPRRR